MMGFLLFFLPFLLSLFFKNKLFGFIVILSWLIAGHLTMGLLLQGFSIFTQTNVILAALAIDLILYFIYRKKIIFPIKKFSVDWVAIAVFSLAVLYLGNVHYNYTGNYTIEETGSLQTGENISYPYPYFSDEWDAIALSRKSIERESIYMQIPYTDLESQFLDYEIIFHSFITELFVLFDADPTTDYINLSVAINALLVLLAYLLLRVQGISIFSSAAASLLILYITNGANLPGVWTLLPMTIGMIMVLLGALFFSHNYKPWILGHLLLVLLFYPPFFIFYCIALLTYIATSRVYTRPQKLYFFLEIILLLTSVFLLFYYFLLIVNYKHFSPIYPTFIFGFFLNTVTIIASLILGSLNDLRKRPRKLITSFILLILYFQFFIIANSFDISEDVINLAWNVINFKSFTGNFFPQYSILSIIPMIALTLAFVGTRYAIKKSSWILSIIIVGIFIWIFYYSSTNRLFIEFQRNIFITSVFITILSGFGIDQMYHYIKTNFKFDDERASLLLTTFVLGGFFIASFSYTERSNWQELTATNKITGQSASIRAPANHYLRKEDLEIFSKIHNARFLSTQWKGKTIGAITDNYPLAIKPGTISINSALPTEFTLSDCKNKNKIANELLLDYVYFTKFDCYGFTLIDENGFGMILYKVEG